MKYAPVLYWKAPCMFWPSLLACAAPLSMFFSWVLQVCFFNFAWSCLHFRIVFPDFQEAKMAHNCRSGLSIICLVFRQMDPMNSIVPSLARVEPWWPLQLRPTWFRRAILAQPPIVLCAWALIASLSICFFFCLHLGVSWWKPPHVWRRFFEVPTV